MSFEYKTIDPDYFYKQFADVAVDMHADFNRMKRDRIANPTDEGQYLDNIIIRFLRAYLPAKFAVGRGYLMNAEGKTRLQQDVVIYNDNNYVLLKNTEGFQIFPIECVYSTIEVKSTLTKSALRQANKNVQSIKTLSGVTLTIEAKTGYVVNAVQRGSVVFSSLFAFRSTTSLERCASNFEQVDGPIDLACVLDKGVISYYEAEQKHDDKYFSLTTTTSRKRKDGGVMFITPKVRGPSAWVLGFLLHEIISHTETHHSTGQYSLLDYLKLPAAEIGWRSTTNKGTS